MKFDLVVEPWLPATDQRDQQVTLGLLDVLQRAHSLKRLTLETPDITIGIHRLLLAILHRAYSGPATLADWKRIWANGHFDQALVEKYLDTWRSRFDLWDARHPFLQDPGADGEAESVSRLFAEQAQGNNATLFDHTLDDDRPRIDAATAARRLVGSQVIALGGRIAGAKDSALANPFASSVTFLLTGDTLFETLALNLLVYDGTRPIPSSPKDAPAWEQDIRHAKRRSPEGHLDLMTWRPRRYRLVAAGEGRTVSGVIAAGEADRIADDAELRDPLAGYRASKSDGLLPLRIDPERALWRDSLPFFAGDSNAGWRPLALAQASTLVLDGVLPRAGLLRLMACGYATDKAKKRLGRIELLPIPAALLAMPGVVPTLESALRFAEEAARTVSAASFVTAQAALSSGDRQPDKNEATALSSSTGARASFWAETGLAFPMFLVALSQDTEAALAQWEKALLAASESAFRRVQLKLGASPRGLRAVTIGERLLRGRLRELFPQDDQPKEAATP